MAEARSTTRNLAKAAQQPAERFHQTALLGMLASGYCAVFSTGALDVWSAAFAGAALVLRAFVIAGWLTIRIQPRWVSLGTLLYLLFYPLDYAFVSRSFVEATVHLVFFVAVVKLLTISTPRDALLLKIIAFLELLAASILSNNSGFFVFLVAFLIFTVAALSSNEVHRAAQGKRVAARTQGSFSRSLTGLAFASTAGILVITTLLFFVLPRTARAALERFIPAQGGISGYSNEVMLGQTGELRRQSKVVMHVRFSAPQIPPGLKWRGNALADFDGSRWYNATDRRLESLRSDTGFIQLVDDNQRRVQGERLTYEVQLDGNGSDALFVAGLPEIINVSGREVYRNANGGLRLGFSNADRPTYTVYSFLGDRGHRPPVSTDALRSADRIAYLKLPPGMNPRIEILAAAVTRGAQDDIDRARRLENFFRTQFKYSLSGLDHEVDDPLSYFLFNRRAGHCEYFASAMAVMLRELWIPARVVTGFQSGTLNPITGLQVVRASDAHSWVEAWLPGQGWVTFDPTPSDPTAAAQNVFSRIGLWLDALDTFWQEWVVGYDLERQVTLALKMRQSGQGFTFRDLDRWLNWLTNPSMTRWNPSLLAAALLIAGVGALSVMKGSQLKQWWETLWRHRRLRSGQVSAHDASRVYQQMLTVLERRGYAKPVSITPLEFARTLPAHAAVPVEEFTRVYNQLRFGTGEHAGTRLVQLLDTIQRVTADRRRSR